MSSSGRDSIVIVKTGMMMMMRVVVVWVIIMMVMVVVKARVFNVVTMRYLFRWFGEW